MLKKFFIFLVIFFNIAFFVNGSDKKIISSYDNVIQEILNKEKVNGTVVIYDTKNNNYIIFNKERANKRFYPASTFKIYSSLIGLETGAVKDVDEIFYHYNGEKVYLSSWACDSNLRYAIKVSQVTAYKELARKIGKENMQDYINKLNFGNKDIGDKIDNFWLDGPLKISAMEQVDILSKLAYKKLPLSKRTQEQVLDITILEKNDDYIFHGKTGWGTKNIDIPIGWFVGWVETKDNIYSFAFNMDTPKSDILYKREKIMRLILRKLEII